MKCNTLPIAIPQLYLNSLSRWFYARTLKIGFLARTYSKVSLSASTASCRLANSCASDIILFESRSDGFYHHHACLLTESTCFLFIFIWMPYDHDIEHGIICFANSFAPYSSSPLDRLSEFANGAVFARLLSTLDSITFHPKDFEGETGRWV